MTASRTLTRAVTGAALAAALGLGAVHPAAAVHPGGSGKTVVTGNDALNHSSPDGAWNQDGLHLDAADNAAVDAYAARARAAERSISPQIRAAARLSHAELVGFDQRLKSPDSLKRKVATWMGEERGRTVGQSLARINDAVRFTLQWPGKRYTAGVTAAATLLSSWGNDSAKWSNTWQRRTGYKAVNSGWRAPRSGQLFEVQFHTPESKAAQLETHKLYEEQRLPGTSPARARELQEQQNALFAAVPVPPGADRLTAPEPRRRAPATVPATG
ncbi:ATP nucleotide 3'-pyrophosphokinase [Streptomyces sp. NPDC014733]|uniref:ATP nucleotide 3'-pyrophosphokinase n=1 Tax=Streptomyces sp. NPDC014733 TaxID=3364885 RepID=UPI0036FD0947